MELFFHIGMEKTATTSTQEWFADNRALLRKRGMKARRLQDGMPEWRAAGLPVAA